MIMCWKVINSLGYKKGSLFIQWYKIDFPGETRLELRHAIVKAFKWVNFLLFCEHFAEVHY